GATYPRLAIEDLQSAEQDQFLLFILSYLIIQERQLPQDLNAPPSDETKAIYNAYNQVSTTGLPGTAAMNFPELAGIHGLPYQAWKGDPQHDVKADYNAQDPKDMGPKPSRFGGYCNHGSVLFPKIAIPVRYYYLLSIVTIWFWDWSDKRVETEGLPKVLYEEEIDLSVVSGTQVTIIRVPNPISYYPFKSIPPGFRDIKDETAYYSQWMRTVRYAPSNPDSLLPGDIEALNKRLKDELPNLRCRLASLFTLPTGEETEPEDRPRRKCQTYDEFSNHTVQSTNKLHYYDSDSLEGIHDTMHDILGGNGHMSNPDYAGFDPIFHLHHCNVDRLYALWEYVYPKDCYVTDNEYVFTQNRGTYALVYNSMVLGETELAPFRLESGKYWTSDHARRLD
ncbi:Di-copper centre-containing protein, partial [Dendrothele bispora CBS 962.96]